VPQERRPERKRIRLGPENYLGQRRYFVTVCCHERQPFFRNAGRAQQLLKRLEALAVRHDFRVHAYCVMPDHVHLLVEGVGAESNLLRFVHQLKQESAYDERKRTGSPLWQRYFYDHILRPRDSADAVAWYIWLNPVRKGLCVAPADYQFSGSFTIDWRRRCQPHANWTPPWKS
jgi:putative transposase